MKAWLYTSHQCTPGSSSPRPLGLFPHLERGTIVSSSQLIRIKVRSGMGFPGGAGVKNPPANAGDARDVGSFPGLGS